MRQRIALPLPPQPLHPTRHIGRIAALQHQPFDRRGTRAVAQHHQLIERGEPDQLRQIHPRRPRPRIPGLQPLPPRIERQRTHILGRLEQHVVEPDADRVIRHHARADHLAVQPLLQIGERRDLTIAHHQQFAIEHRMKIHRLEDFRKRAGNVLGAARIEPPAAFGRDKLHADAVPFPFGAPIRRLHPGKVRRLQRMRQHRRTEHRRLRRIGPRRALLQPREQRQIRRRQAVPHLLHIIGLDAADLRQRDLRQPRRDADAQSAGDQLEQCQPHRCIGRIQPARDNPRQCRLGRSSPTPPPPRRDAAAPHWLAAAGHISATVSARSPT